MALRRQNMRKIPNEEMKFHEAYGLQRGLEKKLAADFDRFSKYLEKTEDPTKHE